MEPVNVARAATTSDAHQEPRAMGAPAAPAVLELRNVTKRFNSVLAVEDVSFTIHQGDVVALLGDNGAGKSTLVKMLSGVHRPTSGSLWFGGKKLVLKSAQGARRAGIATVYQDLALVPTMNVWRNFFLGAELRKGWHLDVPRMRAATEEVLTGIGLRNLSSVDQNVATLSGGEQQALSIGRAVYFEKRLLLLDEPTAALSVKETAEVFEYIRRAATSGIGVVVIMHNTSQALEIANRVIVMRHGRVAATFDREGDGAPSVEEVNAVISGVPTH
jgi:simple sugar transport system ATP-binding protein